MKKVIKYLLTGIGVAILRSKDQEIAEDVNAMWAEYGLDDNNNKNVIKLRKQADAVAFALIALSWPVVIFDSYCGLLADFLEKKYPMD